MTIASVTGENASLEITFDVESQFQGKDRALSKLFMSFCHTHTYKKYCMCMRHCSTYP